MLSVEANERRQWIEWIQNKELFTQMHGRLMKRNQPRAWDGFIHGSRLDWDKAISQQVKEMLPNPNQQGVAWTSEESRAGELFHEDMQTILNATMGTNAIIERHIEIPQIRFRGTPDRIQLKTPIGNVLMEFKTENTYMKDKTNGDRLYEKVQGMLEEHRYLQRVDGGPMQRKYWGWSDKQLADLEDRLRTKTKISEPRSGHMTQLFTYAWILQQYCNFPVDWNVLVYLKRDSYKKAEFWWPVAQSQDLIVKAQANYAQVYNLIYHGIAA